jgi:hypothetical protein
MNHEKIEILKLLYQEHRKEIAYFRDNSFKVMSWAVGYYISITAATLFSDNASTFLVPVYLGLAIAAHIYLHKNYITYVDRWKRLSEVEEALGLFTVGDFIDGKSIIPASCNPPTVTYKGTLFFILAVWIVALSCSLAVWLK